MTLTPFSSNNLILFGLFVISLIEDIFSSLRIDASILKELKISSIRLMTNNPNKIKLLEENGVNVTERLALIVEENELNAHYLGTKAKKSGHLL